MKKKQLSILSIVLTAGIILAGCSPDSAQAGADGSNGEGSGGDDGGSGGAEVVTPAPPMAVEELQGQLEEVYDSTHEAVVNISSQVMSPGVLNQPVPQQGAGSGFIWDSSGHVVTNYHVVGNAESVSVALSTGEAYEAELIGSDPFTDLAVLRIDAETLPEPLSLADSDDLGVGQFVAALGNPFNFDQTLTFGVISALGRVIRSPGGRFISEAIQTDTPINPGNSGGPLLDLEGRVIGVNSTIISPSGASAGIGFAISANTVSQVVPALIEEGEYPHPWLGVQTLNLRPGFVRILDQTDISIPVEEGLLIVNVLDGSPADQAGLEGGDRALRIGNIQLPVGGDIIVGIDGNEIGSYKDLVVYLERETEIGETIEVRYYRGEREMTAEVTIAERPAEVSASPTD